MASIVIKVNPKRDGIICRWIEEMNKKYPRYVSMFLKLAITHYIDTGDFIKLGSIPAGEYTFERQLYYTSLPIDEKIADFLVGQKEKGIPNNMAVRQVLEGCIEVTPPGSLPVITSFRELVPIPRGSSRSSFNTSTADTPYMGTPFTKSTNEDSNHTSSTETTISYSSYEDTHVADSEGSNSKAKETKEKQNNKKISSAFMDSGTDWM